MILLAWMATGYKYVDYTTGEGVTKDVKDDDNKENNSDAGAKASNSTSDLTTGPSPTTDIVAVTATASATSAVGVRGSNVGGNGANNLHQLSIANN